MRTALALLALLLCAAPAGAATHLRPGSIDLSFGAAGMATVKGAGGLGADVAIDSGGRTVVAGSDGDGGWLVRRLRSDGRVDRGFGDDGTVRLRRFDFDGRAAATGVALEPDGDVLVVGRGNSSSFAAARLDASGEVDTGFGDEGWSETTFGAQGYYTATGLVLTPGGTAYAGVTDGVHDAFVAIGRDGRLGGIALDGRSPAPSSPSPRVVRGAGGSPDLLSDTRRSRLAPGGGVLTSTLAPYSVAGDPAGRVVPMFVASSGTRLGGTTPAGALDGSFGAGGFAVLPRDVRGVAVVPAGLGRTLVAYLEASLTDARSEVTIARLDRDGRRDRSLAPTHVRFDGSLGFPLHFRVDPRGRPTLLLSTDRIGIRDDYSIFQMSLLRVRARNPLARLLSERVRLSRDHVVRLRVRCLAGTRCRGTVRLGDRSTRWAAAPRRSASVRLRAGAARIAVLEVRSSGGGRDTVGERISVRR